MKRKSVGIIAFVYCLFIHMNCYSQQQVLPKISRSGKSILDFIPSGYSILSKKEGDLNKDKKADIVLVLKNIKEDLEDEYVGDSGAAKYNRIVLILFNNDTGYTLAARANQLAICKVCGFALADFDDFSLDIKGGIFILYQHGGHTQQWSSTRKFRYQNGDFFMIGMKDVQFSFYMNVTPCDEGPPGSSAIEVNLITGERIVNEIDDDCKATHRHDKIKVNPLVKMSAVNLNDKY